MVSDIVKRPKSRELATVAHQEAMLRIEQLFDVDDPKSTEGKTYKLTSAHYGFELC
ncbi:hypothetical protein VroAM7_32610 [Vibrio rotiferianus]|uniref:Uncharacterized protein n=1 Tax=Vibrio rotiferianus TaxID=190895 RepID=A0A510IBV7_9VIBR|nr:hypothetical protein VroAM7_32610 [Vibrio rotiferianus]